MASLTGKATHLMSTRTGPVARVERGDQYVVCGSNGGNPDVPNWYRNLVAAGEAHLEVGGRCHHCTFAEVTDDAERDECWDLLVAAYPNFTSYQELTDRRLPVGVLTPE